jgi:hypothetical protein
MSTYHSPGCQITGVSVMQGATRNQAFASQSFAITVNVQINNQGIRTTPGTLSLWHTILQDEQTVAEYTYNWWLGNFPWRFSTSFWHSIFQARAIDMVQGARMDRPFLYKPRLSIQMLGPGGIVSQNPILPEFAVVEEDCYFAIGTG